MVAEEKINRARRKLKKILKRAEKSDFNMSDLLALPATKRILKKSTNMGGGIFKTHTCVIFASILGIFVLTSSVPDVTISMFGLKWSRPFYVKDEPCSLEMPDEFTKIFRPPVSCSICHGVKAVEKVSNLSSAVFEERYAYTGKPIVVVDGTANWSAQHVFGFEFFKKIYTTRMEQWKQRNCQFFPYLTEFKDLDDVFNMSRDRASLSEGADPWYVGWSNCDDDINQILRRHYDKPYFLPETAETKRLDWIFMGSSGFGAPMHVDNVEHPSWQAQLQGRKKWRLQPPPECFYECETVQVVVEPGEIIVLDTNRWYHSTLIISKEMSITIGAEYD